MRLTTIVHQFFLVRNTNDPKNSAGTSFPPQKRKNSAGVCHKLEIRTEW